MGRNDVNVVVRARDEASRKFRTIGGAAGGMGSMFRKAAAAAAVYFGVRAIKRFTAEAVTLYGVQETAVNNLSAALDNIGFGGDDQMRDMQAFASGIQKITTAGDEATLELMAMGASMGKLHGETLKKATKAAMGLAKAYKMDTVAAMRLVARAAAGDTASLTRYGIKLDATLTTQEKFNEVLRIGIDNFVLAEAETNTFAGKLQQMKNALGDVKEVIGHALMPVFMSSTVRITEWAENNQAKIGEWASKTVSYMTLVKDTFSSFATFLKDDWKSAADYAFDSFLVLMKTAFESAVTLAIAGGKGIWKGVKKGISDGSGGEINRYALKDYKAAGGAFRTYKGKSIETRKGVLNPTLWEDTKAVAASEYQKRQVDSILGDTVNVITATWKDAAKEIHDTMPAGLMEDVDAAFTKHQARLAAINNPAAGLPTPTGASPATTANGENIIAASAKVPGRLSANESRFLTMKAGTNLTPTDKNTDKMVGQLAGIAESIKKHLKHVVEQSNPAGAPPITLAMSDG